MFLTVTPNLCIERTIEIPNFALEKVHRVAQNKVHLNAGGKGINAARVAAAIGCEVCALTWVGRRQAKWFREQLHSEGIAHELIEVEPDTRICTNILHGEDKKTEVVEAGAPLPASAGAQLLESFRAALPASDLAAVCGSYPPGESDAALEENLLRLCEAAKEAAKKLLVDSKGAAFEKLLKSGVTPWAIKPNSDEAAALLGHPVETVDEEIRAVHELMDFGVPVVLMSCGKRGAYLGTEGAVHFFAPPRVREISAVGSGDSFVGAFAARFLETGDVREAIRWGCAAGAASAASKLSAFCSRNEVERLLAEVEVTGL